MNTSVSFQRVSQCPLPKWLKVAYGPDPASVAVLSVTLTFDLQGQKTGNAQESKITGRIPFLFFFLRQN